MDPHYLFLVELLIFSGAALGFASSELWWLHKDKKKREAAKRAEAEAGSTGEAETKAP
ncbi:MAG: hypothetical protein AAGH48_06780 [Pseudomonadota bacterium]